MGPNGVSTSQRAPIERAPAAPAGNQAQGRHASPARGEPDGDACKQVELSVQLSDFVGEHGAYQLAITMLLFVRYVLLGLMASSGPLMTPDVTFYCRLPMEEILLIMPNISTLSEHERELEMKEEFKQICQLDLHLYQNYTQLTNLTHTKSQAKTTPLIVAAGQQQVARTLNRSTSMDAAGLVNSSGAAFPLPSYSYSASSASPAASAPSSTSATDGNASGPEPARIRECTDFTYQLTPDQGLTMTSEFDLVCDRDWLRSLFQSLLSAAIVVAHVFWGTFSDKYGRFQAQRICLVVSLLAGLLSMFALDFWTFTLARALCSLGDLGMVVSLTTTVVELVGSRYRGLSVALVNFGYALGVSLLPYVVAYFENFRVVVGFTVLCHIATIPFVLATNESVRWLLTNRKFKQARRELKRISRWNRSCQDLWRSVSASPILAACHSSASSRSSAGASSHLSTNVFKEGPDVSEQQRLRRRSRKEAFELLFRAFIEQIESQNMCDPCAATRVQKAPVGTPTIPSNKHDPRDGHHRAGPSPPEGRESPAAPQAASSSRLGPATGRAQAAADGAHNKRRASSCGHMDRVAAAGATHEPKSTPFSRAADQFDALEGARRRPLEAGKTRTLTLPLMSRESSFGENEFIETHLAQSRPTHPPAKQQPDCINLVAHQLSFMGRVNRLFRDKQLMICVFTIVWTTFNSELLYTSFIIINLEVGEDVYLNYILGGCMEALAAIVASLLLSYSPRRVSLIAFWLLISLSCFGLSLAHIDSHWAVWMLALAKFSQSSLSSIASVAAYESFPTFLRQSGSGLVFTLGMLGSVFAPLIFAEFDDHAGMDRVLMTFSFSSLTAAILIYLYLNETRNRELQ